MRIVYCSDANPDESYVIYCSKREIAGLLAAPACCPHPAQKQLLDAFEHCREESRHEAWLRELAAAPAHESGLAPEALARKIEADLGIAPVSERSVSSVPLVAEPTVAETLV